MRKRVEYQFGNIIAMDKTVVWGDVISKHHSGKAKSSYISLEKTSLEKFKMTVCLTVCTESSKKKPFLGMQRREM